MPKKYVLGEQWKKLNNEKDQLVPAWQNLQANMRHAMALQYAKNLIAVFREFQKNPEDPRFKDLKKHMNEGYEGIKNYSDEEIANEVIKTVTSIDPTWSNGFWTALGNMTSMEYASLGVQDDMTVMIASVYDQGLREVNAFESVLEDVVYEGRTVFTAFNQDPTSGKMVLNEENVPEFNKKMAGFEELLNGSTHPQLVIDPGLNDLRSLLNLPHETFKKVYEMRNLPPAEIARRLTDYEIAHANSELYEPDETLLTTEQYQAYMDFLVQPNGPGVPLDPYQEERLQSVQKALEEKRAEYEYGVGENHPDQYIRFSDLAELPQVTQYIYNLLPMDDPMYATLQVMDTQMQQLLTVAIAAQDAHVDSTSEVADLMQAPDRKLISLTKLDELYRKDHPDGLDLPSFQIRKLNGVCKDILSRTSPTEDPLRYAYLKNMEALTGTAIAGVDSLDLEAGLAISGKSATAALNDISAPSDDALFLKSAEERRQILRQYEDAAKVNPVFIQIAAGYEQKTILAEYVNARDEATLMGLSFDEAKYRNALIENNQRILESVNAMREKLADPTFDMTKMPYYKNPETARTNFGLSRGLDAVETNARKALVFLEAGESLENLPYLMATPKVTNIYGNTKDYPLGNVNLDAVKEKSPQCNQFLTDLNIMNKTRTTEGLQELSTQMKQYDAKPSAFLRTVCGSLSDFCRDFKAGTMDNVLTPEEKQLMAKFVDDVEFSVTKLLQDMNQPLSTEELRKAHEAHTDILHGLFETQFTKETDELFTEAQRKQMMESSTGRKNSDLYQEMQDAYVEVEKQRKAIQTNAADRPTPEQYREAVKKLHDKSEAYEVGRSGLFYANSKVGEARKKQATFLKEETAKILANLDTSLKQMTLTERNRCIAPEATVVLRAKENMKEFEVAQPYKVSSIYRGLSNDLQAAKDPFHGLRNAYGPKASIATMPNHEEYEAIDLPIPEGRDADFVMAVMIGACMDPSRLKGPMTSSSADRNDALGILTLNQLFFVDGVLVADRRSGNYYPVMMTARKEAKIALEEYQAGNKEKAQKLYANFLKYAVRNQPNESFEALGGKVSHSSKEAVRLAVKFMDDPDLNPNPSMNAVDRIRMKNFERICKLEADGATLIGTIFDHPETAPEPGSEERKQWAENYIFNRMIKNALNVPEHKRKANHQVNILKDHMKNQFGLEVTGEGRSLGNAIFEDGELNAHESRYLEEAYLHHHITPVEILLSEDSRVEELRAQYSDAIKNSPEYARLVYGTGDQLRSALDETSRHISFDSFQNVQPDMSMATAAADAINETEKEYFQEEIEKATFDLRNTANKGWDKFLGNYAAIPIRPMNPIQSYDTAGRQTLVANLNKLMDFLDHPDDDNPDKSADECFLDMKSVRNAKEKLTAAIQKAGSIEESYGTAQGEAKKELDGLLKDAEVAFQKAVDANDKKADPILNDEDESPQRKAAIRNYILGLQCVKGEIAANRDMMDVAYQTTCEDSPYGQKTTPKMWKIIDTLSEKMQDARTAFEEACKNPNGHTKEETAQLTAKYLVMEMTHSKVYNMEKTLGNLENARTISDEEYLNEQVEKLATSKSMKLVIDKPGLSVANVHERMQKAIQDVKKEEELLKKSKAEEKVALDAKGKSNNQPVQQQAQMKPQ